MQSTFSEFADYGRLARALIKMDNFPQKAELDQLGADLVRCISTGNKLIVFGNGGSAGEASHFAAELVSKCSRDHQPWPALCLNDSSPIVTAIANDYGYEKVFQRQLQAYVKPGDVVVGLSTSGKSPNVVQALSYSATNGNPTYLLTGPTINPEISDQITCIHALLQDTPRIQELHLVWIHMLSEFCETQLA
jgi:D-sedoheptulose 7-phosphate isomerase